MEGSEREERRDHQHQGTKYKCADQDWFEFCFHFDK